MSTEPVKPEVDPLEAAARQFLSYAFLFKSWMRSSNAKLVAVKGDMIAVNEEMNATFGYHSSELLGQCVDMLLPDGLRSGHKAHRDGYDKHPKNRAMSSSGVLKARHKLGHEFPVKIDLLYHTEIDETLVEATIWRIDE